MTGNFWWLSPTGAAHDGPVVRANKRVGLVRADGRKFVDDTGAFFPLGASLFWALWGWKHDRARTEQNLQLLMEYGFDYIRIFGEVGGSSWADRTIDPRDSDYESLLADLLDTLYNTYGMRAELTVFAGGTSAPVDLVVNKVLNVIRARPHTILSLEAANEAFQNFPDHDLLRSVVRELRSFGGLVASSSQEAWLATGALDNDITNTFTLHTDRGVGDGDWRKVRQPWDAKEFRVPGSNNEPPGPQSSVSMLTDPLRLVMLRAVGILCGMAGFVLHTGAGVRGGGAADLGTGKDYLPRKANIWEYGEQLDTLVSPLRSLDALIPENVPNWTKTRHHWDDHPLRCDEIWPDPGFDHGVVRAHAAYAGGQFIVMPIGVKHYANLIAKDACRIKVTDPLTGNLVDEQTLTAGEVYQLAGADDPNASAAYIITGER